MADDPDPVETVLAEESDPRLTGEHVRYLPAIDGTGYVVIVGVVHDHPASIYRAERVVAVLEPDVLAVELPRVAIPLFESFGREGADSEYIGGEMSRALREATGAKVGIDAPSLRYARKLFGYLAREGVPPSLYWRVADDLARSTLQAIWTVVAAGIGRLTGYRFRAHTPVEHEASRTDSPEAQARAENDHIATRQAFLKAIEIPESIRIIDAIRERVMAERIVELRAHGDVVAIVGIEHLDPVADLVEIEG